MDRRDFLKTCLAGGTTLGTIGLSPWTRALADHSGPVPVPRTVINTMMLGGADLRYLFAPDPTDIDFSEAYLDARLPIYRLNSGGTTASYANYVDFFNDQYLPVSYGGASFGIHHTAEWLASQFEAGHVAIVCNVLGSANRRHDHSQLISHTGDPTADGNDFDVSGWGGRLAEATGAASNAVAMTGNVPIFCKGSDPANRLAQVIHARNTRSFALPGENTSATSEQSVLSRALTSYYAARGAEIDGAGTPADWPFRRFFDFEASLRQFGDAFADRLAEVAPAHPPEIARLYSGVANGGLGNSGFGRQIANVYDCVLANDILGMRVGYLDRGGWDTHSQQQGAIEGNLRDFFRLDGAFHTLTAELGAADGGLTSGAADNVLFVFNWDFGRQLRANGDRGTDHGRGNYTIMITQNGSMQGGVYGQMFPDRELDDSGGPAPIDTQGADIQGETGLENVLAALSDWTEPGAGNAVFPNRDTNFVENGVDLNTIFV